MIQKTFEDITVFISQVTLNDTQRKYPAFKEKEDKGYWTGSLSTDSYTLAHLKSKPSKAEIIEDAIEILKSYGISVKIEQLQ